MLSNTVATSYMWLLGYCDGGVETLIIFNFNNLNLSGHLWLVATGLDSTDFLFIFRTAKIKEKKLQSEGVSIF